jgi:hypothetical protein
MRIPRRARGAAVAWLTGLGMVIETWPLEAGVLAAGAVAVALGSARLAAWAFPRQRRRLRRVGPALEGSGHPGACDAWLHVVSGATPRSVTRGVVELSARFLDHGHRVLLVDGARRLRLEQGFGREARWGFGECLEGALPVLGVVQDTGCAGLLLLARGSTAGATGWSQLGRVLEETRPYFGRVVLALDQAAPREAGQALSGLQAEAWWSGGGALPRARRTFSERLGIHCTTLALTASPGVQLEAMRARHGGCLATAYEAGLEAIPPPPPPPEPAATAPILDCDLRVRERLRFLLWMRRIRSQAAPAAHAFEAGAAAPSSGALMGRHGPRPYGEAIPAGSL